MSILTKVLGGAAKAIIPTLGKEKARSASVDGILSKRGKTTQAEVFAALGYKYLRLALVAYLAYAVVSGQLSLGELLKLLALGV